MTTTIKPEDVKRLREQTGAGVMDCKRALEQSDGDVEKATAWLREKGLSTAAKKAGREAREGVITSYIHQGARLLGEGLAHPVLGYVAVRFHQAAKGTDVADDEARPVRAQLVEHPRLENRE